MGGDLESADESLTDLRTEMVLNALPRAIVICDRAGLIRSWNEQAESLYGWRRDEALGAGAGVIVTARGHEDVVGIRETVLGGDTWKGEIDVLRRNGDSARIFAIVSPLRNVEGEIVGTVMAADDMTERRRLEYQSRELADHLRLAIDAGELGTFRWDMASGVTTWDTTLERLFGLEPGEFDGTFDAWVALLHPDDAEHVLAIVDDAVATKGTYEVDHRVVWPDGSVHWLQGRGKVTLDDQGNVTGTIGCTADITARKLAEVGADERARAAAQVAERERLQRERLEFLADISRAALGATDHQNFMRAVTAAAVPRLGDWCSLHFLPVPTEPPLVEVSHVNPDRVAWARELMDRYPFDPNAPTGVAAVIRTGEAVFIPDVTEAMIADALEQSPIDLAEAKAILDALDLTSLIVVPLESKRGVLGAMQFVSAESNRHYDESDLTLARAAAGRIADALDNMWLTDKQRHIAVTLQAALLPPALPPIPRVQTAVRYWPAGAAVEVGGDFYDIFSLDDDRWAVVIGDVCGTGPNGAAVASIARHTIRAAARHGQDHTGVLEWLNDAVLHSNRDLFCTTCFATLTVAAGCLWRFATISGGHPLPVVVRADGQAETVGAPGTLLGVFGDIRTDVGETTLHVGDTLFLYTDGISDVPPPHTLTTTDVLRLFSAAATAPDADACADAVQALLSEHLPMDRRDDDVALMVFKFGD